MSLKAKTPEPCSDPVLTRDMHESALEPPVPNEVSSVRHLAAAA